MSGLPEHIEQQIADLIAGSDVYLLEISRRGQQNSTVIEIIVDSETGVDLDSLAVLSREISTLLDEHEEAIKGRYRLEVSTPGLDRPLEHEWQFRKNIGRLVKVLWENEEGVKQTELFRLKGIDGEGLVLEKTRKGKKGVKQKESGEEMILAPERIERINVEPEI